MASDFLFEYFCKPAVTAGVQGYNLVNTAVYALMLFILCVYVIYPFLKKKGVAIDYHFMVAALGFVLFGSSLRVLNDLGFVLGIGGISLEFAKTCSPLKFGFYTFTPGIWFLTAAITILALIAAKKFSKNEEGFKRTFLAIGILISLPALVYEFSIFREWVNFGLVVAMVGAITFSTKKIVELKYRHFFADKASVLVVAGQALDASATFVATSVLKCGEQHPLSGAILGANPLLFILVKVVLALLIIHAVDHDVKDENFRGFVKLAIIILGFSTGGRDLLTLGVGTCS